MLLLEALEQIPGIDRAGILDAEIRGISYDSRSVQKGDLFVAIRGEKTDGARFVRQAVEKGAAAVASETRIQPDSGIADFVVPDARRFLAEISRIFYHDPSSKLDLVAITGTNGKTTTTYLLDSLFNRANLRSCVVGTLGMKIGPRVFLSEHTTPESPDLLRFLQTAVQEGCTHGALEVSSHSLALKRVFGTRFTVGVFTNLTRDHLDFHKDMEGYFQAKRLLFSRENENHVNSAVINRDDEYGKRLEGRLPCSVVGFGFGKDADIRALHYRNRTDGTDLNIATPLGEIEFHLRLIGRPNIYNVMAATGAALCLGISLDEIRTGIEALEGIPGRIELVEAGQDFTVIVDYAHSPDSLENLLHTVSQLPHKRIITVFGCGGDRDRTKRPVMGEIATKMSDVVLATSDNPRSENPLDILGEIEAGLRKGPAPYEVIPDRRRAIRNAIQAARAGDIVVIAGKGHEDYQIIGTAVLPFDDRKLAREFIQERMQA
jgi:UDP-N-acetylmuramoyl-L-alanyl-D-glutamate--2,6-diaminopimelate ligase